jgi:hypothetical protein
LPSQHEEINDDVVNDPKQNDDDMADDITEEHEEVIEEPCVKKFAYNTTDNDEDQPSTVQEEVLTVQEEILEEIFEGKNLNYLLIDFHSNLI